MRFTTADSFISYCVNRRSRGRFQLDNFRKAMDALGNPQHQLKSIHIAGTNGKGSTTNFLRSILQEAHYRVGSFTSPHLQRHNDRIRINDIDITDEELLHYGNHYYELIEAHDLSMFEIDTLVAIAYFIDKEVDYAIFEVGLGGRLDATNIIVPILSIITTIGYDHMEILGHTLEEIALEKAGIIKKGVPLLTGEDKQNCLDVFAHICDEQSSKMMIIDQVQAELVDHRVQVRYRTYTYVLASGALYQAQNSSIALQASLILRDLGVKIEDQAILKGLESTQWKGRFEQVSNQPRILIDGAHNIHGIQALCQSLKFVQRPIVCVFSALKDKESELMVEALLSVVDQLIVTEFEFYRAAKLEDLSKNPSVLAIRSPKEAIRYAISQSLEGTCVVTGSLYFISEVREEWVPALLKEFV